MGAKQSLFGSSLAQTNHFHLAVLQPGRPGQANLAAIGTIGTLVKTLKSAVTQDEVAILLMGPMGGDNEPSIGEERVEIRPSFVMTCRQALSRISTTITCRFEPRS